MKDWMYKAGMVVCILAMCGGSYVAATSYLKKQEAIQAKAETERAIKEAKLQARKDLERVYNSAVKLGSCDATRHCYTGTGFVIKSDYQGSFILTNKHVCLDAKLKAAQTRVVDGVYEYNVLAMTPRKGPPQGVTIVKVAQNQDLCLIRAEQRFQEHLSLADKVTPGDKILTFGFPGGLPELNYGKYLRTEGAPLTFYSVTDAKVYYGASGSAVVNMDGKVVGVILGIRFLGKAPLKDKSNITDSVFVPLEEVREFLGGL